MALVVAEAAAEATVEVAVVDIAAVAEEAIAVVEATTVVVAAADTVVEEVSCRFVSLQRGAIVYFLYNF